MRTVTRLSQVAAVAALGFSLAACGSSSSSGGNTASESPAAGNSTASAAPTSGTDESSATGESSTATDSDSETPDATTLIHDARKAYAAAESAHMHADVTDSGDRTVMDIKGAMDGSNQELDMTTAQGNATVRTVDSKYYIKGDEKFWTSATKAPKTSAQLLADKWVSAPATMASSLQEMTIKSFLDETIGPDNLSDSDLKKATTSETTYDGQEAYVVKSSKTDNTITIAADTKYVLEVNGEQGTSSSKGKVTIDGWDDQPKVEAPSNPLTFPSTGKN